MSKRKNLIIISISTILLIIILSILLVNNSKDNYLERINYNKINEMINSKETFTLCISKTTCTHCQSFKPKLKEVANKYKIKIYYVDIDKENEENKQKLLELLSLSESTPTTIFIKKGEEATSANRINGDVSKELIIERLKNNEIIH